MGPQKVKHGIPTWPSHSTPGYVTKRTENRCSDQYLYTNAQSGTIHNHQRVKIIQIPASLWMHTQHGVCPCSGIVFSQRTELKTDSVLSHGRTWNTREVEEARHARHVVSDSIYMKHLERAHR